MLVSIFKVVVPLVLSFIVGIALTPGLSDIMYRYRLWKRSGRGNQKENPDISPDFSAIHDDAKEISTPRVGGVVIWLAVIVVTILAWGISQMATGFLLGNLDFLSRSQTWLPLFGLIVASLIGLGDDLLQIFGKGRFVVDGFSRWQRVAMVTGIGLVGALWFFQRLDMSTVYTPFIGSIELGWLFIPFFIVVMLATFSGGVIDGIDGLAGGVLASAFSAFAVIAFFQNQIDLAALSSAITGGILAFLWFNIPPARFYMGETGIMGLTITLAIIAFLTDQVLILPIVAFPLVATSASVIIQKFSRRFFGKRVFRVSPLHHHFQSLGWSSEKITMRYWIISMICAVSGIIVALLG